MSGLRLAPLALAAALALAACTGNRSADTTLGGAALGAGAGAIIGGINDQPATGALIGGALGAAGGALYDLSRREQERAAYERYQRSRGYGYGPRGRYHGPNGWGYERDPYAPYPGDRRRW